MHNMQWKLVLLHKFWWQNTISYFVCLWVDVGNKKSLWFFFNNQLHAVSRTQQGRQRKPSVKTLCSPLSAKFWRHCVLRGRTERQNIYLIKYFISSSGDRTHNQSIYSHTLCPCATTGLYKKIILTPKCKLKVQLIPTIMCTVDTIHILHFHRFWT